MSCFVTTDDLTSLIRKAHSLGKIAETAQRLSSELDRDKDNMKAAGGAIEIGRKRLQREDSSKKRRGKIERTVQYHQELLYCTAAECERKIPKFSEAIAQLELVLRDLAEIYESLARVPRFEHAERSSQKKTPEQTAV
jgi:hypothetical protein